jgi:hypothetical protein
MSDLDLDELRDELSDFAVAEKKGGRSPREERVVAGFEEIQRFVETHGRSPKHGEGNDIFERLYAVRLDRLRALQEWRDILLPLDHQGLLAGAELIQDAPAETMDDDELLAELTGAAGSADITELRHVRPAAEKRAAEEIANRARCEDFDTFKPLFDKVQTDIGAGLRQTRPFQDDARINAGDWFILHGQKALVAAVGEEFVADYGRKDRRLRVIFDNATEAAMLKRSLERALQKDPTLLRRLVNGLGPFVPLPRGRHAIVPAPEYRQMINRRAPVSDTKAGPLVALVSQFLLLSSGGRNPAP